MLNLQTRVLGGSVMERSTAGSILRSTQAWCAQLCEKQTLTHGIAYYSEQFAALPQANQFREVVVDSTAALSEALAEADEWFRSKALTCHRWAPAEGLASDEFNAFLARNGFRKRVHSIMALATWSDVEPVAGVRVLHARAMRAALRATFVETESPNSPAQPELSADACEERLNDPQFDMFVATVDGEPAGRCALFQVGDIARVMDLSVLAPFADRGVDAALVSHVLALAKRLAMRNICVQVDESSERKPAWFERFGFRADGSIEEFDRIPVGIVKSE